MKRIFILIGILLLCACGRQQTAPPSSDHNVQSSQLSSESIPNSWAYRNLETFPLKIALPNTAIVEKKSKMIIARREPKYIWIESRPDWKDPMSDNSVENYFFFNLYHFDYTGSSDELLESLCKPEGMETSPGYQVIKRWQQNDLEFVSFSLKGCEFFATTINIGKGIIFGDKDDWYIVDSPDGDWRRWGNDGWKYFDIALHSIRPVNASNSSTSS